jgi:hypothetical protein
MQHFYRTLGLILISSIMFSDGSYGVGESRTNELGDGGYVLMSWNASAGDRIGTSVALRENLVFLGAPHVGPQQNGDVLVCNHDVGQWDEVAWLSNFAPTLDDFAQFGQCVATSSDMDAGGGIGSELVAVGAPGIDTVFLFHGGGSGTSWLLRSTLVGEPNSRFGSSIAMAGDLIVVGAPLYDELGLVTMYEITSNGYEYIASVEGASYKDQSSEFGFDVAIEGGLILVGAPGNSPVDGGGSVSLYSRDNNSLSLVWSVENGGHSEARFGASVAMNEGQIAIGVPGPYQDDPNVDEDERGRVELYSRTGASGEFKFELSGTIETDLPSPGDQCGQDIQMRQNLLVIGAPGTSIAGDSSGMGMIYQYSPSGNTWRKWTSIIAGSASSGGHFGTSVAIGNRGAVFASPFMTSYVGETGLGIAYHFPDGIDGDWQRDIRAPVPVIAERGIIAPGDGGSGSAVPYFGRGLAASGNYALVADPEHSMLYWFHRADAGSSWEEQGLLMPPDDGGGPADDFGLYVEKLHDVAIVGLPDAGTGGEAVVYHRDGTTWTLEQTLVPTTTSAEYGAAIAIERADDGSTWCAVGDTLGGATATASGVVHVYRQAASGDFELQAVIDNDTYVLGNFSRYGHALDFSPCAAEPMTLAVGDPVHDGDGAINLYECEGAGVTLEQTFVGDSLYQQLGVSVAIDSQYCVVGCIAAEAEGSVHVYTSTAGLRRTDDPPSSWFDYVFTWNLSYPSNRTSDHFGTEIGLTAAPRRIFVSSPGLDYSGLNAGAICSFAKGSDPPNAWNLNALLISPDASNGEAIGGMALCEETVLVGRTVYGSGGNSVEGRVYDFPVDESISWVNGQGGPLSGAWNWSADPESMTGVFSMLLSRPYTVQFDVAEWYGNLKIVFDTIAFQLVGSSRIGGDLTVSSAVRFKTAQLAVTDGVLEVADDLIVGSSEPGYFQEAGKLIIATMSGISIDDRLALAPTASVQINIDPSLHRNEDPVIPIEAQVIELGGSLEVSFDEAGVDPTDLKLGDQFTLLHSVGGPFQSSFDVTLLPGIPGGELAFTMSIVNDGRGAGQTLVATVVDLAGLLDFGDPNSLAVTGQPTAVEVVDLTGDGAEEICIIFADSPGSLAIFENNGSGGISQQIVLSTGDLPIDITSGDFDGDGHQDLAIANFLSSDVLMLYNDDEDLSDGFEDDDADGNPGVDLDVDAPPKCLAGIDYNFDSYRDLIVGLDDDDGDGSGYLQVYLGASLRGGTRMPASGGKTSSIPKYIDPSEEEDQKAYAFTVAQEDGQTAAGGGSAALHGTGTLVLTDYTTGVNPGGITSGDFNGDGFGDIAVTSATNGTVAILRQDSTNPGAFLPAIYLSLGSDPSQITSVDFNADGNVDMAAITYNSSGGRVVRILQNDGGMSFTSIDTAEGEDVALLDAGDINGTGGVELVTISGSFGLRGGGDAILSLRPLDSVSFCTGDINANGEVEVLDLLEVLSSWNCVGTCGSDVNDDAVVDVLDLLLVISNWGPCD